MYKEDYHRLLRIEFDCTRYDYIKWESLHQMIEYRPWLVAALREYYYRELMLDFSEFEMLQMMRRGEIESKWLLPAITHYKMTNLKPITSLFSKEVIYD